MSALRRFVEALRGSYAFFASTKEAFGLTPEVSFREMWDAYIAQPAVRVAVDFRADQIVGAGFYTSMNEDYDELRDGRTAKEYIDDFCEAVGLDEVLQATARDTVGFGNCFWWLRLEAEKTPQVSVIPIFNIERIVFNRAGSPAYLKLSWDVKPNKLPFEEVVHVRTAPFDKNGFGTGILQTLCKRLSIGEGETRYSFVEIVGKIQNSITRQFQKFGAPNELWVFPKIPKKELEDYHRRIQNIPSSGSRFVTNVGESKVQMLVPERTRGFDYYIQHLSNEFYLGLQTPLPKLFTTPGFTEASAKVAAELDEKRTLALQRLLKRVVERRLFNPILEQAGFDPRKAGVRLNWGMIKKPKFNVSDVLKAFELGAISQAEVRKILLQLGWPIEVHPASVFEQEKGASKNK